MLTPFTKYALAAILVCLAIYMIFAFWGTSRKDVSTITKKTVGHYLGPIAMTVIRIAVSVLLGLALAGFIYLIDHKYGSSELTIVTTAILALIASFWFFQSDEELLEVPVGHAAMLTFMGARLRIYLTEGNYAWTGKRLLLGRSKRVLEPGTDENGFIFLGDIQIVIWNQGSDGKKNTVLSVVARDTSTIYANLLIAIKLLDPMLWLNSHDPLLDIAERTRSTFRTAAEFFVGTDNPGLKNVLRELMLGKIFLGSFLQKQIGAQPIGSVVQDIAGVEMFEIADSASEVPAKEVELVRKLAQISDTAKKAIAAPTGGPFIEERSIEESLKEVIKSNGAELRRVSIGDITLSETVATAANAAASEAHQRAAQIASAETVKTTRKILAPTKTQSDAPGYEMAAMIAAAQDNKNIKVVYVPGADPLTRAAIAGASQIGK